jgi:hypothetical protein
MPRGARLLLVLALLAAVLAVVLQLYRLRKPVCPLFLATLRLHNLMCYIDLAY